MSLDWRSIEEETIANLLALLIVGLALYIIRK
jgi:hypothetical protein